MYNVLGRCPLCSQDLTVTRLHCRHCDLTLEGHFALGRFARLSSEELHFVETFIRCEGKLNRMQEELELSYPTVRSRLHDVIRALGYQVEEEPGMPPEERKDILEKLARGTISSDEAVKLLQGS